MCRAHRRSSSFTSGSRSSSDVSSSWFVGFSEECQITGTRGGAGADDGSSETADSLYATGGGRLGNWIEQGGISMRSSRRRERELMQLAATTTEPGDLTGIFAKTRPKLHVEARRLR